MANAGPAWMRWLPIEWQKVAAALVDFLDAGLTREEALHKAQRRALPEHRWRDADGIRKVARTSGGNASTINEYIERARKMTPAKRAELLPLKFTLKPGSDVVPPNVVTPPNMPKRVVWTQRECCLITRRVNHWRQNLGDTRATCRLVMAAQKIELPPERRRGETGLSVSSRVLDKMMKEAKPHLWQFDKTHPFDPNRTTWEDPAAPVVQVPVVAPQTAQVAPEVSVAPIAHATLPAAPQWVSSPAAQVFANEFTASVDKLMRSQQQAILEQVNARLSTVGESMAKLIAVFVTNELKGLVHGVIETELGGPVATPASSAAGAPERDAGLVDSPAPAAPPKPRVRVDVVGINDGSNQQRVIQQLNGSGQLVELKFIDSNSWNSYYPGNKHHVVMVTTRVPHKLMDRFKAAHVQPVLTKHTVGHVVTAVQGILRGEGVLPAAH